MTANIRPTEQAHTELQVAYDFFNGRLFGARLPACMIVYNRKANSRGYYAHERWISGDSEIVPEIAMNPEYFLTRPLKEVLSTLAHEMCHFEQFALWQTDPDVEEPSRRGYHNKGWGKLMKRIGLFPSSTAQPGGKETGQKVSHYILAGGPFDLAVEELLESGFKLTWSDRYAFAAVQARLSAGIEGGEGEGDGEGEGPKPPKSKYKYTCGGCNAGVWGKPGLNINCGDCDSEFQMEA